LVGPQKKAAEDIQENSPADAERVRAVLAERAGKLARAEPEIPETELIDVLRFQLAYSEYALEMRYIKEVILTGEITPVPGAPAFISGICAVRGQIISLVDLRVLFSLPERGLTDLNRVIVITDGKITFGILADNITGIGTVLSDRMVPPAPDPGTRNTRSVKGIVDGTLMVLDGGLLLADPAMIIDEP
jgi:chemotaxis signal transduction protein